MVYCHITTQLHSPPPPPTRKKGEGKCVKNLKMEYSNAKVLKQQGFFFFNNHCLEKTNISQISHNVWKLNWGAYFLVYLQFELFSLLYFFFLVRKKVLACKHPFKMRGLGQISLVMMKFQMSSLSHLKIQTESLS